MGAMRERGGHQLALRQSLAPRLTQIPEHATVPPPPPPVATATRPPATPHRVLTQITFSRSKIGIAGRRAPLNNSQAL